MPWRPILPLFALLCTLIAKAPGRVHEGRCTAMVRSHLVRAAISLERLEYRELANRVAWEATDRLFVQDAGMFRSHPGEDRCDAVDAPGFLLLALLYLETEEESVSALGF